jgi:hypothetical protein
MLTSKAKKQSFYIKTKAKFKLLVCISLTICGDIISPSKTGSIILEKIILGQS